MRKARIAGAFGLLAVALVLIGNVLTSLSGEPDPGASGSEYARFLAESPPGTAFWAGAYVEVLGLLAFLFFFPALWSVLSRGVGDWDWLAVSALAAGLTGTAVKLASGPIAVVAYDRAPDKLSGDVAAALIESNGWSFVLTFAIDGAFLLAAGALIVLTGVMARWLGWAALVLGVGALASVLGGLDGPPGILLLLLWIVVASLFLLVRPARVTPGLR